jgi:uncharacterized membrane protein YfcA
MRQPMVGELVTRAATLRHGDDEAASSFACQMVGQKPLSVRAITGLALAVGVVGGTYGIGGGSLLGPLLGGRGLPVALVAPAALTSTFLTSIVGAVTYALLGLTNSDEIAPNWHLGLLCGLGGLVGSHLGARLQPRLPEQALRVLLGVLAIVLALLYIEQATTGRSVDRAQGATPYWTKMRFHHGTVVVHRGSR